MKVELITTTLQDGRRAAKLLLDGRTRLEVTDMWECPEDATLGRDLGFFYSIPSLLEEAYNSEEHLEMCPTVEVDAEIFWDMGEE